MKNKSVREPKISGQRSLPKVVWIDLKPHTGFISQSRRLFCVCSIVIIVVSTVKVLANLVTSFILRRKKAPKQTAPQNKQENPQTNKKPPKLISNQRLQRAHMFSNQMACWKQLSACVRISCSKYKQLFIPSCNQDYFTIFKQCALVSSVTHWCK